MLLMRVGPFSPCLRVLYSCGCGRIDHFCLYPILADADEKPVFACTLFVQMRTNIPYLRVHYSW